MSQQQDDEREIIAKQGGNVVTYFCTPDGRVLHFVVGPVPVKQFLESARWSYEFYRHLLGQQAAGKTLKECQRWMKEQHEEHLSKEESVQEMIAKWVRRKGLENVKSVEALRAKKTLLRRIESHVGDKGHVLLRDQPLPVLRAIEAPVFEKLAGEVFNRRSHQLRKRILMNIQDGRPILLMVSNVSQRRSTRWLARRSTQDEPKFEDHFPDDARVRRHLEAFHTEVLTRGELTAVNAALNRPPIITPPRAKMEYVILDSQGEIANLVTNRDSLNVLALVMEKYSGKGRDKVTEQEELEPLTLSPEALARSELRVAIYVYSRQPEAGVQRLKKILIQYPDTEAADDALWRLARLSKRAK